MGVDICYEAYIFILLPVAKDVFYHYILEDLN